MSKDDGDRGLLGGYALLVTTYGVGMLAFLRWADHRGLLPDEGLPWGDLALLAVGTHKASRIVTKDFVTAPLRAPFTRQVEPAVERTGLHGEVIEEARGEGLQRALGDLLTCEFCFGPWATGALLATFVLDRRVGRLLSGVLTASAVSDFLHLAYLRAGARTKMLVEEASNDDEG